ncbi:MAG: YdcF family protein [Desulfomonile sp.]|nr:YdcF family protein [Desulfomonile sp.]
MDQLWFVLKKIIVLFLFPVPVVLFLALAALVFWRRRSPAFLLVFTSLAWLAVTAFPLTGLRLIAGLEDEAGPYADPAALSTKGVRYVVVLSGDFHEGEISSVDRLGCSVVRLIEGIRLWKGVPGSKLVLTGGMIPGLSEDVSIAKALADVSLQFGVPREALVLEDASWTTEDQAKLVAPIVGKEPFALVTSAYHMPRSLMLFRYQGVSPIPAPADFKAKKIKLNYSTLIPQARGLEMTQIAQKERLAMLWLAIKYKLWYGK